MQHLQSRAQPRDPRGQRTGDSDRGLLRQHRPEPLAPGEDRVAHCTMNRGWHGRSAGQQLLQRVIGQRRAFLQDRFHVDIHRS